MAEVENAPETPQEPAASPVGVSEAEFDPAAGSASQNGAEAISEGPSLDDLQAELQQAATALRTSEDLRQNLHSQLDDAEARVKAAEVALERERVGRRHGLPDELMGFLRGESAEELEAEAKTLAKYAAVGRSGLGTGGLDPTEPRSGGIEKILRSAREF
ncbi:hypothetical protein KME66_15690 [Streptomyces sp. YPW6]|uniref:hypothetical protein n=1 Tax=Streptomyces sp. YPW6 TaxID=2840373 RepID=UPI001C0BD1FC|nr:hypothetical protein [Streptomyces sp. YPW6]QWQ42291.1 hypothetical protein KME66_15690 [Streptomyces sp. YPW6]